MKTVGSIFNFRNFFLNFSYSNLGGSLRLLLSLLLDLVLVLTFLLGNLLGSLLGDLLGNLLGSFGWWANSFTFFLPSSGYDGPFYYGLFLASVAINSSVPITEAVHLLKRSGKFSRPQLLRSFGEGGCGWASFRRGTAL